MEQKKIFINETCIVGDVQETFSSLYPFLKIEFYKGTGNVLSAREKQLSATSSLTSAERKISSKIVDFGSYRTVAEVTDELQQIGLNAKIYRKSGNVWNVVSLTQNWTLDSQNKAGEFVCREMKVFLADE